MDEMTSLEARMLEKAIESGRKVKIFLSTGYFAMATVKDYDCNVIVADVKGEEWVIYRHSVSTIIFNGGKADAQN